MILGKPHRPPGKFRTLIAAVLLGLVAGCHSKPPASPIAAEDPVAEMRRAMRQGDWRRADQYTQAALIAKPGDAQVMVDAAQVAALNDRKRAAARLLVDAVALSDYQPAARVDFAVQALIDVGEVYDAIELLERSLVQNPDNIKQRRTLLAMLGETQRTERIAPHFQKLIQARQFDVHLLEAVTEISSRRFSHNTDDRLLKRNPDDHRVRLGEAHEMMNRRDFPAALEILDEILEHHPTFAPAHAMQRQVLMELRQHDRIADWIQAATDESRLFADYWLTLGDLASEQDQVAQAARAFWEATRRDANNSTAWTRLAAALRRLQRGEGETGSFSVSDRQLADIDQRIENLLELRKRYYDFVSDDKVSQQYATAVAALLTQLGRNWEAEAWTAIATTLDKDPSEELQPLRNAIVAKLKKDSSWLSAEGQPALALDLSGSNSSASKDRIAAANAST